MWGVVNLPARSVSARCHWNVFDTTSVAVLVLVGDQTLDARFHSSELDLRLDVSPTHKRQRAATYLKLRRGRSQAMV